MLKNVAGQTVNFQAILKADGNDAGDISGTATVEVNVDKVGFVAGTGTFKFLDNGTHEYTPTQAETNGDYVVFRMRETTVITVMRDVYPTVQADYKADVSGLQTLVTDVDGLTLEQSLRVCLAALAGKLAGATGPTVTIRDQADTKPRITATVDNDGNRTAVTVDAT